MLLVNPFTGQVINTWSDAARAASALARRLGRSYKGSKRLIHQTSKSLGLKKPIYLEGIDPRDMYGSVGKLNQISVKASIPSSELSKFPKTKAKKVVAAVGKGPYEREVLMHEIGHIASGHHLGKRPKVGDIESEAWDWAIKNAKKHNISKRKLVRLKKRVYADAFGMD